MVLTTEPTELQKKAMFAWEIGRLFPQWYNEWMNRTSLKVYALSWSTGIPVEDISRFWMKTRYSLDEVCMIFSAHGIHAFEEYGIDRYPRVCDGD